MEIHKFFENMFGQMEAQEQDAIDKAIPKMLICLVILVIDTAVTLFSLTISSWVLTLLIASKFNETVALLMVGDAFAIWFFTLFFTDKVGGFWNLYTNHQFVTKKKAVNKLKGAV